MGKTIEQWEAKSQPQEDTFDADALEVLKSLENPEEAPENTPEKDKSNEEAPKEEKKSSEDDDKSKEDEWKSEKETKKQEDDLKIPRSRLNKEIEKKNSIQSKYDKLVEKINKEEERLKGLSEDELEEQENLQKLWIDTKLSKLQDKLDDLNDDISDKDNKIKELQETIKTTESSSLKNRIDELTSKKDWSDWLPKFDIEELIKFWEKEWYMPKDPVKLYNMKYQAEIFAKKYEKVSTKMDKWNKGDNKLSPKKTLWFDRKHQSDFDKEAENIINSIWSTT